MRGRNRGDRRGWSRDRSWHAGRRSGAADKRPAGRCEGVELGGEPEDEVEEDNDGTNQGRVSGNTSERGEGPVGQKAVEA